MYGLKSILSYFLVNIPTLKNMGVVHKEKDELQQALFYYNKTTTNLREKSFRCITIAGISLVVYQDRRNIFHSSLSGDVLSLC